MVVVVRLIDADALNLELGKLCDLKRQTPRGCLNRFDLADALDAAPTITTTEKRNGVTSCAFCGGVVDVECPGASDD